MSNKPKNWVSFCNQANKKCAEIYSTPELSQFLSCFTQVYNWSQPDAMCSFLTSVLSNVTVQAKEISFKTITFFPQIRELLIIVHNNSHLIMLFIFGISKKSCWTRYQNALRNWDAVLLQLKKKLFPLKYMYGFWGKSGYWSKPLMIEGQTNSEPLIRICSFQIMYSSSVASLHICSMADMTFKAFYELNKQSWWRTQVIALRCFMCLCHGEACKGLKQLFLVCCCFFF